MVHSPAAEDRPTSTARRVTMREAMRAFDAGRRVLVHERGHLPTVPVGPLTTTHSKDSTTFSELRAQVNSWRRRYPNQRYYVVDDTPA